MAIAFPAWSGLGDYGHPIVAWSGRGMGWLGWLGDDTGTLADLGFDSGQIQQIMSAHQSGALSDGGYQAIVSGFVGPAQLADFLQSDPGVTGVPTTGARIAISDVNATLAPGASPTVAAPSQFAWFGQSTIIAGMPNWIFVALGFAFIFARKESRPRTSAKKS